MKRVLWLGLTLISAAACGGPTVGDHEAEGPESAPAPDLDLAAIARHIHFAFRDEGAVFTSEHETHAVVVEGATIRVTPVAPAALATTDPANVPAPPGDALAPPTPPLNGAPLTLTTRSVRRGAALAPGESATIDDRGRLVRAGAGYTEILQNAEAGVELSWAFEERPAGDADLEVRVEASGLEHVADTDGGIHFRDPASTLGVRFGHATWVDAAGARTAVRVQREGADLVMRVPAELVDRSSFPAVLDPVIGPEIGVDAPIPGAPSGSQQEPSIAFDGSDYFVAWYDRRSGSTAEIVGTRVSAAGLVLDPQGIVVSSTGGGYPSVVFDGTDYLVVWASGQVYGQRISTAGALVGARITIASNGSGASAVHSAGTTFVAFYRYSAGTYLFELARLSGITVLDPTPILLASRSSTGTYPPRAAFGGGTLLVTWGEYNGSDYDLYAVRASAAGVVLDGAPIAVATGTGTQFQPWPASDGTNFLVAYYDGGVVRVRTVASATGALGAAVQVGLGSDASVAYVVDHYRIVWVSGNSLRGNRVTPAGVVLDPSTGTTLAVITGQNIWGARVIAAGAGAYLGWTSQPSSDSSGGSDVHGSRLTAAGVVTDAPGVRLSTWSNGQRSPALASNGTDFLAVWQDDRDGVNAIYGVRISGATGMPLDAPALLISAGGRSERFPAVAWNGTHWLVVWWDARSGAAIYGARVSAAGALIDPTGLALVGSPAGIDGNYIDVASDGAGWLVVWRDYRASTNTIYGMRVSAAGAPLDVAGGFAIGTGANFRYYPRVAYGLGQYIVAWLDYRSGSNYDLYASRVSSAGAVLDPAGIAVESGPGSIGGQAIDVGASATDLLVAYNQSSVRVARVSPSTGAVLGDTSVGTNAYYLSLATGDGVGHLLGNVSTTLRLTRFDAAGADIDVPDVTVSTTAASNQPGAIDTVPGRALIAYSTYDSTPGVTAMRVVTRTIDTDPLGATCSNDLQCESGSCVDGVCCNSACGGGATNDCQACSVAAGAAVDGTCGPRTMGAACRGA
ncbi:MAG: hypothetical protein M3Y87_13495, partial [Myxococcota bacterium]|nr:hypothetical protein [Myxococcota bacterium]